MGCHHGFRYGGAVGYSRHGAIPFRQYRQLPDQGHFDTHELRLYGGHRGQPFDTAWPEGNDQCVIQDAHPTRIDTDDPTAKESTLLLRVLVEYPVELLPTLLFWQPGEPLTAKVIRITAGDGFNVKAIDATCPDPAVDLHLDTIKPGADYKLTVTPKGQNVRATITVKPDIEGKPQRVLIAHVRVS